jgi:hypothetical protein
VDEDGWGRGGRKRRKEMKDEGFGGMNGQDYLSASRDQPALSDDSRRLATVLILS